MSEQKRTLIFINLIITSFSSSLLATSMVVALPHIAADLNVSLAVGQWVTSGFALAGAIIAPLSAFLINRVSTKKLYLSSLILITFRTDVNKSFITPPCFIKIETIFFGFTIESD